MITVSLHAYQRAKQRMGLSKHAIDRLAGIAYYKGIRMTEAKGSFLKFLREHFTLKPHHTVIVFANMVFLYDDNLLVTVVHLPAKYYKYVRTLTSKPHDGIL